MRTANAEGLCQSEGNPPRLTRDRSDATPGSALSRRRSASACSEKFAKNRYSDEGSTNWNISGNVIENNGGPNFVWMSGCRDTAINNSWSDNLDSYFYPSEHADGERRGLDRIRG